MNPFSEEFENLVDEEINNQVKAGILQEKLCFVYCGEDFCNCVGGNRHKIWDHVLRKTINIAHNNDTENT